MYSKIFSIMLQYQVKDVRYQFHFLNSKSILQISILCNTQHKIHFANTKSISYHFLFDNEIFVWEIFKMELIFSCQFLLQNTKSSMIVLS